MLDNKKTDEVWFKKDPGDKVWFLANGEDNIVFSFDRIHKFYLYRDYSKMTKEQKEIFDKENPFWADFFTPPNERKAKGD